MMFNFWRQRINQRRLQPKLFSGTGDGTKRARARFAAKIAANDAIPKIEVETRQQKRAAERRDAKKTRVSAAERDRLAMERR